MVCIDCWLRNFPKKVFTIEFLYYGIYVVSFSLVIESGFSSGSCTFKRRELATSLETRRRFPELVVQEEKRVRFVVVNGLDIVEKPNSIPIDDAEW